MERTVKMEKMTFWCAVLLAALLPCSILADAQPSTNVLVWGPIYSTQKFLHVSASVEDLKQAYEEIISQDPAYASKYPGGIRVTGRVSNSLSDPVDLPANLDEYALVFIFFPYNTVTSNQVARLKTVTARGGRLVLVGEHSKYAPHENEVLTALAKELGAHFQIGSGAQSGSDTFNGSSDLLSDPLTCMPSSAHVAPITYSGVAQEIARLTNYPTFVWAVDEAVGNGRMTVFSDTNWYIEGDAGPLSLAAVPSQVTPRSSPCRPGSSSASANTKQT